MSIIDASRYLTDRALEDIWCNEEQDRQLIFRAKKISKPVGELNNMGLTFRTLELPSKGKRYHIFLLGHIHPSRLGLLYRLPWWTTERWLNLADSVNETKVIVNLYISAGVEIPKFNSYFMFTNERGFILAIEEDDNFNLRYSADIYLRVYSNAYYESRGSDSLNDYTSCEGRQIKNPGELVDMQTRYNILAALPGYVFCTVNGMRTKVLSAVTMQVGDTVELMYDSSVKRVYRSQIKDLLTFESLLDSKMKYLIHPPKDGDENIDYHDDIDIHIYHKVNNTVELGVYYHRNTEDSHRMVTHKDYSLPVDHVVYLANELKTLLNVPSIDISEFYIELKIRKSGYNRPLVFDANRVFELYKLSDADILGSLVGVNSVVDVWTAENLENSDYTKVMRAVVSDVQLPLIEGALGYNSMSKMLGDTPQLTQDLNGSPSASLPYGLLVDSTVYDYDVSGVLLGTAQHNTGELYTSSNPLTKLVEVISGTGLQNPGVVFGQDLLPVPAMASYRVYMTFVIDGITLDAWEDITDGGLYEVIDGVLHWLNLETDQLLMIRSDDTFLDYELTTPTVNGNLFFTLSEFEDRGNGLQEYILPVPLGDLDLWLNGKSLIADIDYKVVFPKIFITSLQHLTQPSATSPQTLHVRYSGFSTDLLSNDYKSDVGFIEHGVLSNNSRFDLRDDKVLRIVVDGYLKTRVDLTFSELHSGVSVVNALNGKPYSVKDTVVPIRTGSLRDTYELRSLSKVIDRTVSDYLTIKIPEPPRDAWSVITDRYKLVSPFIASVISDLEMDIITNAEANAALSINEVSGMLIDKEWLLDFDPINPLNALPTDSVVIHPHLSDGAINLTAGKYLFLQRVVDIYCRGLVSLDFFITF